MHNYYTSRFTYNPKREKIWKCIANYIQRYISPEDAVLDIGAGYCNFINNINAKERVALDISPDVRQYANKDVKAVVGSCTDTKLPKAHFDSVFASNILEHLDPKEFENSLKEINRLLKTGGKLIILQPNFKYSFKEYFDDYTHKQIFTHIGMADMLKAVGFEIEKIIPKFLPFSIKSRLPLSAFLLRIYLRSPIKPFAKQMLIIAKKSLPKEK